MLCECKWLPETLIADNEVAGCNETLNNDASSANGFGGKKRSSLHALFCARSTLNFIYDHQRFSAVKKEFVGSAC
jgi:hypothetical protein